MALHWIFFPIFHSLTHAADIELLDCGPPDIPKWGGYGPRHNSYTPGDVVHYYCDIGTHISGNFYRKCEDTGDWSGDTPVCDGASKFSYTNQSSSVPNGDARNAVDGLRTTCTSTEGGQKQEWLGIFTTPGELIRVMLFFPIGQVSFEIVHVKKNGDEVVCGSHTAYLDRYEWTDHNCVGPNNRDVAGVKIRSLTNDPLQICEIEAHVLTSPKCIDPHLRVEDGRLRLDRHKATLMCNSGFRPGRERSVECIRESVWNRKILYCLERQSDPDETDTEVPLDPE